MAVPRGARSPRPSASVSEIPPGPNAGRVWRDTPLTHCDSISGRLVMRLTGYRGHSHHRAGAAPCWFDDGRQLVLVSDRDGCGNLFAYDFSSGAITQLTDLRGDARPQHVCLLAPKKIRFDYDGTGYEVELDTLRMREASARPGRASREIDSPRVGEMFVAGVGHVVWIEGARQRRALARVHDAAARRIFHADPCAQPGGERVVFAAEVDGYSQIFAVESEAPENLPRLASLTRARR